MHSTDAENLRAANEETTPFFNKASLHLGRVHKRNIAGIRHTIRRPCMSLITLRPAAAWAWWILEQVKRFHSHVVCPVVAVLQQR